MNIFISKNNELYMNPYKINNINCFTEYGLKYEPIQIYQLKDIECIKQLDHLLLYPFTHINNIWHLIHHLFICYKFMKKKSLSLTNMYPIFFKNFSLRQGNLIECTYKTLMYEGMGFSEKNFEELHYIFSTTKSIQVNKLYISNESINFNNEPLFESFKHHILNNLQLSYNETNDNITFILRRGTREISNIDEVKKKLTNVQYIYLEDYSIKKQVEIFLNSKIVIGLHGAGLSWLVFMKSGSQLIELYPGNSNTDNYIRFCNIAKINYKRLCVNITKGNERDFRNATVNINDEQILSIKKNIKPNIQA